MSESCFSINTYISHYENLQYNQSESHRILTNRKDVFLRKQSNLDKMTKDRKFVFYEGLLLALQLIQNGNF